MSPRAPASGPIQRPRADADRDTAAHGDALVEAAIARDERRVAVPGSGSVDTAVLPLVAPRPRRIGASDLDVFPIALNGKAFGWTADVPTTEAVLDRFVELGGDFVDTADVYAGGRSEIMIGNWMRERGNRDRMVLATKIGKSADHPGLATREVTEAVEASLRRLDTDRIDLLYLHFDDVETPFEETLIAVDALVRAGKVRWFGGADHTGERLLEARVASGQLGVAQMVALQNSYSLLDRTDYEGDLERVAGALRLGVMPRFALAHGTLAHGVPAGPGPVSRRSAFRTRARQRRAHRVLDALDRIAKQIEVESATVALAWLLSRPHVVAPVVSASSPEQVAALTAAAALRLSRAQVAALERASTDR